VDIWIFAAAIFFCTMGTFAGAAALYVTATPVSRLFGHQAAEIVLFCMFAIALFAEIATLAQTTLGQTMWTWISR
jgi:threonine aldolase